MAETEKLLVEKSRDEKRVWRRRDLVRLID